jgi:hypothetical protein
MEAEHVEQLKELFDREYQNTILDLRDLRLADRDAVRFLRSCEADGMKVVLVKFCKLVWVRLDV